MLSIIKNRGLAFKLIFFILTSCIVIFVSIFSYNYGVSRGIIIEKIEENANNLTLGTVSKIETILLPVEKIPEHLAQLLEEGSFDKDEIQGLLRLVVKNNPDIYGTTIAFEPYAFDKGFFYFAPYFYKKGDKIEYADLGTDSYKYPDWDWYKAPKELGRPVWSEPYFDKGGGNIIMSTYSVPFYRTMDGKKTFTGVVTADISLSWLQDIVSSIKIEETGYAALLSRKGTVVTHPEKDLIMDRTIFDVARAEKDPRLEKIGEEMVSGHSGFAHIKSTVTGKESWISYAPVPSTGWSLAIVFPKNEMMAGIANLNRAVLFLGIIGIVFLFAVIILISNSITRPLRVLAQKTGDIAKGNFDFELPPVQTEDEVGALAGSFNRMKKALKRYILDLEKTTSAKEKIESELKIAHNIQMGILPKTFPPFPDRSEFDVYAELRAAREVGGDFYDFYFIDDDLLCFVIGDVSGKGVPAALFMAMTKTILKMAADLFKDPVRILERANRELSRDNPNWMFVTIFCGVLNVKTGEVHYANGGHNPPLLIRKDGAMEFLSADTGTIVGAFEDTAFSNEKLLLEPGDTLYLYTDGVTEAVNEKNEQFTEERLKNEMSTHRRYTVKELVRGTFRLVDSFASGMPQADDITVLTLRYFRDTKQGAGSAEKSRDFTIRNELSEIKTLTTAISRFSREHDLPDEVIHDIVLATEELVNNTINYGYDGEGGRLIDARADLTDEELVLRLEDDGKAFNPLDVPEPDTEAPLEERPIGGLGIHIARSLVDGLEYRREQGKNIVVLKKKLK
jgi:sigma-B regulation protein RsbU (phosphoserine phosphatase)